MSKALDHKDSFPIELLMLYLPAAQYDICQPVL